MNEEAMQMLRALVAGQELLGTKVDGLDMRLSRVEGRLTGIEGRLTKVEADLKIVKEDVKAIYERQGKQDRIVNILTVRTTRLEAKVYDNLA